MVASNKYLINCLVLVQPDFEINEVLNSILIVRVGGWGRGLPLNGDIWSFKALIKVKVRYEYFWEGVAIFRVCAVGWVLKCIVEGKLIL